VRSIREGQPYNCDEATEDQLRYQTFGLTGFSVSTVSMGGNRIGDPGADPAQWSGEVR